LHKPPLAVFADHIGLKPALAPHHGFNQTRIQEMFVGDLSYQAIVPFIVAPILELTKYVKRIFRAQNQVSDRRYSRQK
jgi:hypothetical protein